MTAATANGSKPEPLTHQQGLNVFDNILERLARAGWTRLRVDTLVHHSTESDDPRIRWTVRHRYDHGVWEFHYEPDAYWRRGQKPHPSARVAKLRLDRPETVAGILSQLFGTRVRKLTEPVSNAGAGK